MESLHGTLDGTLHGTPRRDPPRALAKGGLQKHRKGTKRINWAARRRRARRGATSFCNWLADFFEEHVESTWPLHDHEHAHCVLMNMTVACAWAYTGNGFRCYEIWCSKRVNEEVRGWVQALISCVYKAIALFGMLVMATGCCVKHMSRMVASCCDVRRPDNDYRPLP